MNKMLVSCVLLFLNGFAVTRNVVVVGRHYVSRYLDPSFRSPWRNPRRSVATSSRATCPSRSHRQPA